MRRHARTLAGSIGAVLKGAALWLPAAGRYRAMRRQTVARWGAPAAIALGVLATLSPGSLQAQGLITFSASLDGSQQVPPVASPGTGGGSIVFDESTGQITVNLDWAGLLGNATAAHIHNAPAGTNGALLFDLAGVPAATTGAVPAQSFAITGAQVTDLEMGLDYMNVHSTAFPSGEIRGQLFISAVDVPGAGTTTISANLPGGNLAKNGTGTLILTGTNTYSGGTTISGGVVSINNSSALGTGDVTLGIGTELNATADATLTNTVKFAQGGISTVSAAPGATLTLGSMQLGFASAATAVFGSAGNTGVVVIGPQTGSFSGVLASTIEVAFGTLRNGAASGGLGDFSFIATTTVDAGATLDVNDFDMEVKNLQGAGSVTLGSHAATVFTVDGGSFSGIISGAGQLQKNTAGTLVLTGTNSYTAGTTINTGVLQIGNGGTTGSIVGDVVDNASLVFDRSNGSTYAGNIGGTGTVTKNGAGLLTLTGASSYSGGTTINGGVVSINNSSALGTGPIGFGTGTELNATADATLTNLVFLATTGSSTISAANGATLTFVGGINMATFGNTVFGSAGNAGVVVIGPLNAASATSFDTFEAAFGTLRNGSSALGLNFFTNQILSTTVDAGATLDLNDINLHVTTLLGAGAVTLGANAATVFKVDAGTFGGVISGAGQLDKEMAGTLVLTGTNTYTGGTTIGAGVLQIGNGGTTGSIVGDVVDNASLVFNRSNSSTYAGNIGGPGSVTKNGAGLLTLTGASSYSGGTTINGGTVRTDNASALGSGPVALNAGAALAATGALNLQSLTWNGGNVQLAPAAGDMINVTNSLTNGGAGGAIGIDITGLQKTTYTLVNFGSTNFVLGNFSATFGNLNPNVQLQSQLVLNGAPGAGNLQLVILGATASGPILQNSPPVNIPTFADFTVDGPVTTGGPADDNTIQTLTFTPGSSLLIHNTLFVTQGPVILVGGSSITLDGSLSASQLQVLLGSLLDGNGAIIGDLINAGIVSPGHSPGRIQVSGNYTQTSTGLLRIEIGGRDLSQHDLLSIGGAASLAGTLELVRLNNFKLKRHEAVTFLTASGGVNGKFATVLNSFTRDTILEPTVVYHPESVALEAVQGSFEKFARSWSLTPNQRVVAGALDRVVNDKHANSLIDYLDSRKLDKLPRDFDKIAPEELTSIFTISSSLAQVQSQNLQRRTDDIRAGSSGFNSQRFSMNGTGPAYSGSLGITTGMAGPNGNAGKESKETMIVAPEDKRWGVFLSGTGEWVSVGDTSNARGYDLSSGGFTLGVDYLFTPHLAIGLAAGYTGTASDLTGRGRVWVNGGKVGVYATAFAGGWYADAAAFGGYNSYDTRRSALRGEARSSTDGGELDVLFGTGYDFIIGGFTFGPTATFNYTYTGTGGFTESGSLAPLGIHGGNAESLRSAVGIKASCDWKIGGLLIRPEIRAGWQHEYGDAIYALDSSLTNGADGTFTVNGPRLGRDSALLGAGCAIQCSDRCSLYLYYDGDLGRKNYQSTSVTGGARYAF